ncbi:hypothetical protein [Alkalibacillus haloalkaliphilus]|uniref:Permease n=2 Tax=Alkalibacillus haloalkaliphilus TaxID=94136 RepID=A0A511W0E1_9BACI|nr:hypothetical protein [Alkalibacillus haloalkaliphilus]GEN44516.1 hypothetical protein AHA02nite_02920 [Alkalibacillus haloalkaliphilus]
MAEHKLSLKESKVIQVSLLMYLCAVLASAFLETWSILILNLIIATVCSISYFILWMLYKDQRRRYFSLASFVMLNGFAIFFAVPFLVFIYGSISFWVGVLLVISMLLVPYLFSEEIALSVNKPYKTRLGRVYIILSSMLLIFGSGVYADSLYSQTTDLLQASLYTFLFSLCCWFVAPVLLIKPKKMDEVMAEK